MANQRKTNKWFAAGLMVLALGAVAVPGQTVAADPDQGRLLHDQRCVSCHDTRVYKRDSKVARDYDEIRAQVVRWETSVALKWNDSEIDAVTTYLARDFYKVPCPVC